MPRLLGGTPEEVPERYAPASPAERLPQGVPALVMHGDADEVVPVAMSRAFRAAAAAAGDDCELVEPAGVGHLGVIDPASGAWAAALERL